MDKFNIIPENIKNIIKMQEKIKITIPIFDIPKFVTPDFSGLLENLKGIPKIVEKIRNNPEMQFAFISNLEVLNLKSAEELKESLTFDLTDEDIKEKENLLNKNLIPYLEKYNLENLWIGANQVLEFHSNPDRLRHCLISLRTILEYFIDKKIAPIEELSESEMFKNEFKRYHEGRIEIQFVKIKRKQKIEYFTSKFDFLDNFTKNEIQYICDCYTVLCNVHQPNIGISENQVRSLKVKTGITIWILMYLYEISEK